MKIAYCTFILLSLTFQSCLLSRDLNDCIPQSTRTKDIKLLSGEYKLKNFIYVPNSTDGDAFWLNSLSYYLSQDSINGNIKIEVLGPRKLGISFWDENHILKHKDILKGNFRNGLFSTRRILFVGIPFLLGFHDSKRIILGTNVREELIILSGRSQYLSIFLFGGGHHGWQGKSFEQISR